MNVFEVRLKSGKAKVSLVVIYRILVLANCKIIFQESSMFDRSQII